MDINKTIKILKGLRNRHRTLHAVEVEMHERNPKRDNTRLTREWALACAFNEALRILTDEEYANAVNRFLEANEEDY